jgi:hypothetical protein
MSSTVVGRAAPSTSSSVWPGPRGTRARLAAAAAAFAATGTEEAGRAALDPDRCGCGGAVAAAALIVRSAVGRTMSMWGRLATHRPSAAVRAVRHRSDASMAEGGGELHASDLSIGEWRQGVAVCGSAAHRLSQAQTGAERGSERAADE